MKELVLLSILALCSAKPYMPIRIMDFMKTNEIMLQDSGDDDDDNNNSLFPTRKARSTPPSFPTCPFGCHCTVKVVQCSDLGLTAVPKDIPADSLMIDLQNNKITEIKENDFKGMKNLYYHFITASSTSWFLNLNNLYNQNHSEVVKLHFNCRTTVPSNGVPWYVVENKLFFQTCQLGNSFLKKEMSANPLENSGIELGAFDGMSSLFMRIAETRLTAVPKDLPSSLYELHLDYNKIGKVELEDFMRYKDLQRLGLGHNQIKSVENGSLAYIPNIRELHLDNNKLKKVPAGLASLKYLQVVYLHSNNISGVGVNDFCPTGGRVKKSPYSGISLFNNPVKYWDVLPATFRCVSNRMGVQLGNSRKRK
ncbi:ASPN protein, partial [Polyodon spathula]|nr:ASPN protein [Polyodon spathula]